MDYEEIMKLNAKDFRKSLEEKKKQKKDAETSFMSMQQDLQYSIERKSEYFANIASLATDAALNGQEEVGLDIDAETEYKDHLNRFGFDIDYKEVQSDLLLKKIQELSGVELKSLHSNLKREVEKIVKILPPQEDSDLSIVYKELLNADDDLAIQVKYLVVPEKPLKPS